MPVGIIIVGGVIFVGWFIYGRAVKAGGKSFGSVAEAHDEAGRINGEL